MVQLGRFTLFLIKTMSSVQWLLALVLVLSAPAALSLGLGRLQLKSALNQAFSAEIEIINRDGLGVEEILPNLATQEDFEQLNVERRADLYDLRFEVVFNSDGKTMIRVNSRNPIVEPFLNFVVEVIWPSGRLVREYTVLLDPPVLTSPAVTLSQGFRSSRPDKSTQSGGQISDYKQDIKPWQAMTGAGDTLWLIASRIRPDKSVSIQQIMLALQKANPDAFIDNNINRLKAGYRLELPDLNAMEASSQSDAIKEVAQQNGWFRESQVNPNSKMTAGNQKKNPGSPELGNSSGSEAELRLVSSEDTLTNTVDSQQNAEVAEIALAVAEEGLDLALRENAALSDRLDQLEDQMLDLGSLVKLKDQQLAALQTQLDELEQQRSKQTEQPASLGLLGNTYVQLLLAGLVVLILVMVMLYTRRRRQESNALDPVAPLQAEQATPDSDAIDQNTEPASDPSPELEAADQLESAEIDNQDGVEVSLDPDLQAAAPEPEKEIEEERQEERQEEDTAVQDEASAVDLDVDAVATQSSDQFEELESPGEFSGDQAEEIDSGGEQVTVAFREDPPLGLDDEAIQDGPEIDLDELNPDDAESDLGEEEIDLDLDLELDLDIDLDTELEMDKSDDDMAELDLEAELELPAADDEVVQAGQDETAEAADLDLDEALEELDLDDNTGNKLDLARAYLEMGDTEGAIKLLEQVAEQGQPSEIDEAKQMLAELKQI
ncbi:MAG: hypothetical protein HOJ61_09325 [Gammaproteobacteria bacterium]|nr:hypothetical protein [Gammaproteobacteria bacterium]MBT5602427.1 hypothetical protein [Gammaproteobacteria bacterium]